MPGLTMNLKSWNSYSELKGQLPPQERVEEKPIHNFHTMQVEAKYGMLYEI